MSAIAEHRPGNVSTPFAKQCVSNNLTESIALAEYKWSQVVLQELKQEELVEASWEHEAAVLVGA